MSSKIERELQELRRHDVISEEVSQKITAYYASKKTSNPNRLFTIFGVLGSLLVGLGIVLILAHNWDEFSRTTKTIWAFIPLVVGQAAAAFSYFKKKSMAWREGSATFLYLAIGASIALISQIYNIPGTMPEYLLTWIILGAPLVYLLRSHAAALLHLIFITSYACNLGYFNETSPWWYLVMLVYLAPYYWLQLRDRPQSNLSGILNWTFPLSVVIVTGAFISEASNIIFLIYVLLFGFIYNIGKLEIFDSGKLRRNGYAIIGSLGTIYVLMLVTFKWFWTESTEHLHGASDMIITYVFLGLNFLLLVLLFRKERLVPFNLFQYAFLIFGIIFLTQSFGYEVPTILTNVLVLVLGLFAIRIGNLRNNFGVLNYGLLIITILVVCRFFDTEIDFIVRGLLFVLIGLGFFATNYLMYKKQQKLKSKGNE